MWRIDVRLCSKRKWKATNITSLPSASVPETTKLSREHKHTRNLSNAIGCCVPYSSTFGMFKSSMNTMRFLPPGGDHTGPRFSMLSYRVNSKLPLLIVLRTDTSLPFEYILIFVLPYIRSNQSRTQRIYKLLKSWFGSTPKVCGARRQRSVALDVVFRWRPNCTQHQKNMKYVQHA